MEPAVVLVSGAPGAGKTTLAGPLSRELGQPVTVMLEANFRPRSSIEIEHLLALDRPIIEVCCQCPPALAAERYALRAKTGSRDTRTHVVTALTNAMLAEFDTPMGLGELVAVDTSGPVDVGRVARQVRALLARVGG